LLAESGPRGRRPPGFIPSLKVVRLSEKNLERELRGATALEQLDRQVKIDVVAGRKPPGCAVAVAGTLQFLAPPELDLLLLCVLEYVEFRLAHRVTSGSPQ
jgi:hypothetical protein